jgi:predicted nucleotidyltransferase
MNTSDTASSIRSIVRKYVPNQSDQIFLFGSYVTGKTRRSSDIDLGIYGEEKTPGAILEHIREELSESSISYTVDVVDFHTVSEKFRRNAMKYIQSL